MATRGCYKHLADWAKACGLQVKKENNSKFTFRIIFPEEIRGKKVDKTFNSIRNLAYQSQYTGKLNYFHEHVVKIIFNDVHTAIAAVWKLNHLDEISMEKSVQMVLANPEFSEDERAAVLEKWGYLLK